MKCDLRQAEEIFKVLKWAFDTFNGIDMLVNNAAMAISVTYR
jgi:NAD(P)-dependent dehydrogenase (short-subunit alcohol dehydrogenase family)